MGHRMNVNMIILGESIDEDVWKEWIEDLIRKVHESLRIELLNRAD